jgi:amino-acid N-acetyltransferase
MPIEDVLADPPGASGEVVVRKAVMHDIHPILDLINSYAAKGIMLPRTEFEMSENIRDFSVALLAERLIGCGALHFYSPTMAEIRSLAVDESFKTHGVGRRIIDALVREAVQYELDAVFAFTYVPAFFEKMGFEQVERGVLPLKAWKDCLRCPKFHSCDEIPMVRALRPEHWVRTRGQFTAQNESMAEDGYIQLPVLRG